MGGFADCVETIPDAPEPVDTADDEPEPVQKDEPPELNLNPKQNKLRTDIEMWIMDELPGAFGVDDSEELDEDLQEDGQAAKITELIADTDPDKNKANADKWLRISEGDTSAKEALRDQLIEKCVQVQEAGPKK